MSADLSLGAAVVDNARHFAAVPAYVEGGRVRRHADLLHRGAKLARALAGLGVRHQDRVAVMGRNTLEFGDVLAMGALSGIVVATVSFRLAAAEVVRVVQHCAPRVVFVDADSAAMVATLRADLPDVSAFVCLDGPAPAGFLALDELIEAVDDVALPFESRGADVANLIYTSGTTGRPKGCILGHREMRWLARTMSFELRTGSDDRALLTMPIFHIGAMAVQLGVHLRGGTCVLHRQFDPPAALAAIGDEDITVLHLAPTMLQDLLVAAGEHRDRDVLSRVRTVLYSAAPMTMPTLAAAQGAMPRAGLLNMYGQTEVITSLLPRELHSTDGSELARRRLRSVGLPFVDNQVRVVDDAGADCPPGHAGEVVVRSPGVFRGYWNDDVQTAETLRGGWCHTGDIGRLDADGLLTLVDRKKDVIISGGENIYSQEVEAAVLTHPDVLDCAVVGVPDQRWGESVCAVVVAKDGAHPTAAELIDHVRSVIARYKAPRYVVFADDLPRLPTGKTDKKLLRSHHVGVGV